eukprot:768661-Hanusia_phi.AAC.2
MVFSLSLKLNGSDALDIMGAGATFPKALYNDAIFAYRFAQSDVSITYLATGSGGGKTRIKDGDKQTPDEYGEPYNIDFAGSDSLLSNSDYASCPDLQMYPAVAGAVVPIFNLPEFTEAKVSLVLRTETVAKIFASEISNNLISTKILQGLNTTIKLFVRYDKSGTTEIWKKSLSAVSQRFKISIGEDSSNKWNKTDPNVYNMREGNDGVASAVLATPYSMGYSVLGNALDLELPVPELLTGTSSKPVVASTESVEFAVSEKGLDFGNNGDDPERLTADVHAASGSLAWPMVGYTYLVMRKKTLRNGASCEHRKATMKFWNWFHQSSTARNLARIHGFSPLPEIVRAKVLGRLRSDIVCQDKAVYSSEDEEIISGATVPLFLSTLHILGEAYSQVDSTALVQVDKACAWVVV